MGILTGFVMGTCMMLFDFRLIPDLSLIVDKRACYLANLLKDCHAKY